MSPTLPPSAATLTPAPSAADEGIADPPVPVTALNVPAGQTQATGAPAALTGAGQLAAPADPAAGLSDTEDYQRVVAAAPRTFGTSGTGSRVTLKAKEQVFVRIETDGPRSEVLFEGMLNKGEVYFVPPGAKTTLVARDGGSVDMFVDGSSKGPAGPAGIALKGLSLDPESLARQ